MELNENNEPLMRVNIKQTAKGVSYYDVTARGNTLEEVKQRLDDIVTLAKRTCMKLNEGL